MSFQFGIPPFDNLLSRYCIYSKRASHHKQMKRPLANILICLLFYSLLFSSFFVLQFRLEKELNQHRQTPKPLENKGFFRLSLLYRNGTPVPVCCLPGASSLKKSANGWGTATSARQSISKIGTEKI